MLLGLLAFFVALPPITAGLAGLAAPARPARDRGRDLGGHAGRRRLAWGAIALGILGIGLGYLATLSGDAKLDGVVVWSALLAAMLRYATPLTFAAVGGMFSERAAS